MNLFDVNWLAVVVAALIPMVVGSLWYGPLFGKKWLSLVEMTEEDIKKDFNAGKSYGGSTVMAFLMAFVLANVIKLGDPSAASGLLWGALLWVGIVVPYGFQYVAWENRKTGLFALSIAYNLVVLLIMGLILALWQ